MKLKLTIFLCMFTLCYTAVYCADTLYDEFVNFKVALYNIENEQERQSAIRGYAQQLEKHTLTPEEKLTLSNLLLLERIVFEKQGQENMSKKMQYSLLIEQNKQCEAFMHGKKYRNAGKWFLMSWGDIKSRLTGFISGQDRYKEAGIARQLYTEALAQDKKFSQGSLSFGLWLYFAPPIAGGGPAAALQTFSNAVNTAANNNEKYLALVYRSQIYKALDEEEKSALDLAEAERLIPVEHFTKMVKAYNQDGTLFFE